MWVGIFHLPRPMSRRRYRQRHREAWWVLAFFGRASCEEGTSGAPRRHAANKWPIGVARSDCETGVTKPGDQLGGIFSKNIRDWPSSDFMHACCPVIEKLFQRRQGNRRRHFVSRPRCAPKRSHLATKPNCHQRKISSILALGVAASLTLRAEAVSSREAINMARLVLRQ